MSTDRSVHLARTAFMAAAWAFVVCLVVQIFLVGLDLFEVIGEEVGIHREFAYLYGWLAPLLVLLAIAGRIPRGQLQLTIALLVLFAIQTYLPSLADGAPQVAAVHAVNAIAVIWIAVTLALSSRELVGPRSQSGGS